MNQKLTVTTAALVIAGTIVAGSGIAMASVQTETFTRHAKSARRNTHGSLEARMDQAVRDGIITSVQKQAFLTELKKLRAESKADLNTTSSRESRAAERSKLAQVLQTWADANNFPLSKVAPHFAERS